jgi:DNA-binding NarL/FixJ family response regulator
MSDVTPIAGELGISEITMKAHRGKAMQKMKADSLADLLPFIKDGFECHSAATDHGGKTDTKVQ